MPSVKYSKRITPEDVRNCYTAIFLTKISQIYIGGEI